MFPSLRCVFWSYGRKPDYPGGVINIVTAGRNEAEILLRHPDVVGVTFVGSTKIGRHIFATAAANGKRVRGALRSKKSRLGAKGLQAGEERQGNSERLCGCAGERCMALPVVCVEEAIADELVAELKKQVAQVRIGPAWDKSTVLGPVVNAGHLQFVTDWIKKGIAEGAELVVDGRNPRVPQGYEKGFYIGPTILDHVKPGMSVGDQEVFGPVLCIKRVKDYEEGLARYECQRVR